MSYKLESGATIGVACLGITHPHTSGRVKAFKRILGAQFLGAYDDSPLLEPFCDALGLQARSKEEILADPNVHVVLVHPKSYLMAEWAIEALEAGKAVLCEKPAVAALSIPPVSSKRSNVLAGCSRSAIAGATRRRWRRCSKCCRVEKSARSCKCAPMPVVPTMRPTPTT